MKIKFYVLNHDNAYHTCFITSPTRDNSYLLGKSTSKQLQIGNVAKLQSFDFHLFLNELNCCPQFHRTVAWTFKQPERYFVIEIIPNRYEYIDRVWGELVRTLVWEQLEIDHMMSWLSTLGGAFSALGDYFSNSADIAGKISFHQMKLAVRLADPFLLSRCFLYFSISLIQKGRLTHARRILECQYVFAIANKDTRLMKMCLGIWSKLQYTKHLRILAKKQKNNQSSVILKKVKQL